MKETLSIVKIGGNVIDNETLLKSFIHEFSKIKGLKILVHGGGKLASEISSSMGVIPEMIEGRRITNAATLEIVTMVYAGLINKRIVALLQSNNCNAIGLSGADANILPASKRDVGSIDYGFVGDINQSELNNNNLKVLLQNGFVPVIAPITHDTKGQLLNTNADTIASCLGVSLSDTFRVKLYYCFELKGVLQDIKNENSLIELITPEIFLQLKASQTISKGMIPKISNALEAIKNGVNCVYIGHVNYLNKMMADDVNAGTKITVI